MTRINMKYRRAYVDGVDLSSYTSEVGELSYMHTVTLGRALSDGVLNGLSGQAEIKAGTLNAFLDNDSAGLHVLAKTGTGTRNLMVAFGTNAAPVAGDPIFAWEFEQSTYQQGQADGFAPVTINLDNASYASVISQRCPFGFLVHPKGAETAVNTATGLDDYGSSTALGGIFSYQLFTSNGTVTLKLQDAATNTNPSFSDLSGATSGVIDASTTPAADMIALGRTATVRRYIRWQIVLGTATTCTFALGFVRSLY